MDSPMRDKLIEQPTTAIHIIEKAAAAIDVSARHLGNHFTFVKVATTIAESAADILNDLTTSDAFDLAFQVMADLVEKHDRGYVYVHALDSAEIVYARIIMGNVVEFAIRGGRITTMWVEPDSFVAATEDGRGQLHIMLDTFPVSTVN